MDLENIFDKINIIPGDKILVHSNILNILIVCSTIEQSIKIQYVA